MITVTYLDDSTDKVKVKDLVSYLEENRHNIKSWRIPFREIHLLPKSFDKKIGITYIIPRPIAKPPLRKRFLNFFKFERRS